MQRLLARSLSSFLPDHGGWVNLRSIDVSPDLAKARVYFSLLDGADATEVQKALGAKAAAMRHQLARELNLRRTPQLVFVHDVSVSNGAHISALIDRAASLSEASAESLSADEG